MAQKVYVKNIYVPFSLARVAGPVLSGLVAGDSAKCAACGAVRKKRFFRNTPSTGNSMTGSERPSPEPLLKKEASPAVLGGREFWKCSGAFKCLEL